jgi:uncharacterized membrane protein
MMKWIDPIVTRFRLWPRPAMFTVHPDTSASAGDMPRGERVAEQVAGSIGSWAFIAAQAGVMAIWVLINSLVLFHAIQWDAYPFVFLNLAMSAEAAFTGPVLLIAANVGATRDHKQADRIEGLAKQNEDLSAQNEQLAQRLITLEQLLDTHIATSLKAHTDELHDLGALVRAVHAAVCDGGQTNGGSQTPAGAPKQESLAAVTAQPAPGASTSASEPAAPASVTNVRSAASGTRQGRGRARRS